MSTLRERLISEGHDWLDGTGGPCPKCYAEAERRHATDPSQSIEDHYEKVVLDAEQP